MKSCGAEEAEHQIGPSSQSCKATVEHRADFAFVSGPSIAEMLFDIAMTVFFSVEFGRIGWQELFVDFRMLREIALYFPAGMGSSSVPDQDEGAGKMVLQMHKRFEDLLAMDGSFEMPFVDFAREAEGHRRGQSPSVRGDLAQDGSFASPSPSRRQGFLKGESKFIPEDDVGAQPPRLFLSLANRVRAKPAPARALVRRLAAMVSGDCIPAASAGD